MKRKSSLASIVLAITLLCAGNVSFTADAATGAAPASIHPAAPGCAVECYNNYVICKNSCDGDPTCLAQCQEERDCCMVICHGGQCLTKSAEAPDKTE